MCRYSSIARIMILAVVSIVSSEARANIPPNSAAQASAEFSYRRNQMARRLINKLVDKQDWDSSFKPSLWGREDNNPKAFASARIAMASAVLWVLSHPSDFDNGVDDAYNLLQQKATNTSAWSKTAYINTWGYWVYNPSQPFTMKKLDVLFRMIYYFSSDHCYSIVKVGTDCDYDFVLTDLAHLIYTFRDGDTPLTDPLLNGPLAPPPPDGIAWTYADFLTNEMIYNIICQNAKQGGLRACQSPHYEVPFAFHDLPDDLVYTRLIDWKHDGIGRGILQAETENHVLNIVTWDYLISNWVMWQGSLMGSNSRRKHAAMNDVAFANGGRYFSHGEDVCERVQAATGRVVHSGMYETNSRPYGRVSLSALLALANFGNPFDADVPFSLPCTMDDVKLGARNAVDYLAAKLTFQSLRGKRQGPMRRGKGDKKRIDFYGANNGVILMSLLSGAYEWRDCIEDVPDIVDGRPKCPILRYGPNSDLRSTEYAAMASSSVGGYRVPDIIREQMFERGPFYARMKSRFTRDSYPVIPPRAEYFDSDTKAFYSGDDRSSFELHFGDDNLLLSAGGSHTGYYKITDTSDFWAKPTMLIPRGDFGHVGIPGGADPPWEWKECYYDGDGPGDADDDVLLSPGKVWDWWESECNIWQYKNFVYGYLFHDRRGQYGSDWNRAPRSFSGDHPFYVPWFWDNGPLQGAADEVRSFSIGAANFEIFNFTHSDSLRPPSAAAHGPYGNGDGYFIVRAKFRKDAAHSVVFHRKHREFARGFLEIIPQSAFSDAEALENRIRAWNFADQFDAGEKKDPWVYVLTMSREKVRMASDMGANRNGAEGCDNGILDIYEYDVPNHSWTEEVDMAEHFIPKNIRDSNSTKKIPLITVWQLNRRYRSTGCKLVETVDEGVVVVRQPAEICLRWSQVSADCLEWVPGWKCLKLDSHSWKSPTREVENESLDCHCFEP